MAETCSFSSTTLGITTGTLAMSTKFVLSFVVPLAYLQNFSGFFGVMSDHAPVLIEILRGLRSGLVSLFWRQNMRNTMRIFFFGIDSLI